MNKEQIFAIIQRGHLTDGDLADALLAELAKVSEPVAFMISETNFVHLTRTARNADELHGWTKLFTAPLPQPDLVAEIEQLRQQLSAAQASEGELLTALEEIADLKGTEQDEWDAAENVMPGMALIAEKAIAAHKARKEK